MLKKIIQLFQLIAAFICLFLWALSAKAQTLTATVTGPTSFTLQISNVYSWRIDEQVGSSWTQLVSGYAGGSSSFSYTRTAGTYKFRLYNCYPVSNGCSTSSTTYVTLVGNTPPATPSITTSIVAGGIKVSWSAPTGATSYQLTRGSTALTPTGTSYTDTSVSPGSAYTYSVKACNSVGQCSSTASSTITYPAVPANPSVSVTMSGANAVVSWNAISGAASYRLTRGSTSLTPSGTGYTDSTVVAGNSYTYTVKACNSAGVCSSGGSASISVPAIPAVPTLWSSFGGATVVLSWNQPTGTSFFQVQRNGANVSFSGTTYKDETVSSNTGYTYTVKACNVNSQCSAAASKTVTIPNGPLFQIDVTGNNTFDITVGNVYSWQIQEIVGGSYTVAKTGGATNRQVYQFTRPGGSHSFQLYNCYPVRDGCSTSSSKTITLAGTPAPAVPVLTVQMSGTSVGVSWTAPSGAVSYNLYRGSTKLTPSGNSYTDSSVSPGVSYSYSISACNATGECSSAASKSITTPAIPATPTISTSMSGTSVLITWTAPTGTSSYKLLKGSAQIATSGNSYTDSAVTAGTSYSYSIAACNSVGQCSSAATSQITTPPIPGVPSLTLESQNVSGNFSLGWSSVSYATYYKIQENGIALADSTSGLLLNLSKPNGSYTYRVSACNAFGCGSLSVAKKVDVAKIASLGSVTASLNQSTGVATVSWGAVSGATVYRVQAMRNGANYGSLISVSSTSAQITPVTLAGSYKYQVTACAVVGNNTNCAAAVISNVVTPQVPTSAPVVTVPLSSQTGIFKVKWSEVVGADRYEVYENGTKITSVATLNYTFTSSNAKGTGQYTYEVKACKALCGPNSNSANIYVNRASSSSSSTSSTGIAVLDQPLVDPLNDVLDGDIYWGGLSGTQSVGNDGSFNYSLPIVIPPGINGIQPSLSLSYNSNRRNGLVGWGWAIGGLSSISRCGANLIRDGYVSGIQHDDQYRYCLDGQRLVEVSANHYRTESESYLRIEKSGNHWTVTDSKGNVRRYGYNTDSYLTDDQSAAYAWFMDKYSDVSGNAWTVTYNKDDAKGTHYPSEINYTQNLVLGTNYSLVFGYEDREDISTKFVAGSKSVINKRLHTIEVKSYGSVIRTYTLDYQQYGRTYDGKLYEDPSKISRLNSVTLCFASGTCAEPVSFNWASREAGDFKLAVTDDPSALEYAVNSVATYRIMLDINGDGKLESYQTPGSIKIPLGDGSFKYYPARYKRADINRDGFDDVIKEVKESDDENNINIGVQFFLSNGTQISETPSADYVIPVSQTNYEYTKVTPYKVGVPPWAPDENVRVDRYITDYVDINADGLLDVVRYPAICITGYTRCIVEGAPDDISVALNNGNGFDSFVAWVTNWNENLLGSIGANRTAEWFRLTYGDYNGDGLLDFIALSAHDASSAVAGINTGSGFNVELISNSTKYALIGDFNGDGITDLLARHAELNGNNEDIKYCGSQRYVNTGQYLEPGDSSGIVNDDYYSDQCLSSVVDYNGDGLDDIVKWGYRWEKGTSAPQEYEGYVYLSLGLDSDGIPTFAAPIKYRDTALWSAAEAKFDMGIFNPSFSFADHHATGRFEDSPYLQNNLAPNVIQGVSESARYIDVGYSSLASDKVYSYMPDTNSSNLQAGEILTPRATARRFGVTQLSVSNGIGGNNITTYSYANAKRNTLGYGDLGFGTVTKIETVEGSTPLKTITHFYQDANQQYNLAGRIKRQQVFSGDSTGTTWQLLSDSRYQWKVRLYDDDVDTGYTSPHYFAYLYETSNHTWDMDGSEVSTSLTQNHAYSASSCMELFESPSILTTASEGTDDVDYHADGVLLYTETATCDESGSTSAVQISATENSDIISAGEARGLVQTSQTLAWVGSSISLADKDNYSVRTQSFTYNSLGQLESKTVEPNASAESGLKLTSTFAYNGYGSVSSIIDTWDTATNSGLSVATRTTTITESIDAAGVRTVVVTKPQALSETTEFEPVWGQPHKQTDANGLVTTTDYDDLGRPSLVSYADGTSTQLDYRSCAANDFPYNSHCTWYSQSKTTGSSAQRTYYDGLGRVVGSRTSGLDGRAVYTVQSYNARGSVAQATAPFFYGEVRNPTVNSYDALGRITEITYPDDAVEHRTYSGLTQSITNRLNQTQYRHLNAAGWVVQSVDNNNTPVDFTYWPFGELHTTKVNDDDATLVTMEYDTLGRKTSLSDPNTGTINYTYNALDLLATQIDAKGQRTCYQYDSLGRQTGRVDLASTDCTGTYTQHWAYDTKPHGKGLLASLTGVNTDGSSYSESYSYTQYSLPQITTSNFGGSSYAVTQYYDGFNRPLGVQYPTGYVAANGYNEYGQLAQVNDSTGATLWAANDSDSLGNVTQFTLGNGVVTNQTFDQDTGLIHSVNASKGSLVIQNQIYNFDSLGNLKTREDAKRGVTQSFCYDGLNRLKAARFDGCSAASNDYTYDNLGNLTHKADAGGSSFNLDYTGQGQTVNNAGPHAVTAANGWSYTYDASGNLTQATKAGESPKNVVYSAFNTPTSITQGSKFSTLVYGPNQDRIKHSDSNGRVTKYVGGIYEEVTKGGVTQKLHYVGDFAIFVQTDGVTPTSHREYLHRDHIGSVVAISNEAANSASDIQWQANGAWGERRFEQWNGPQDLDFVPTLTAHGFTDHEQLDAVGLIHMNGRVYDPELGRFLSADPLVQSPYNSQSYNRYSYVFNNPLSFTDPTGFESKVGPGECDYSEGGACGANLPWDTSGGGCYAGSCSFSGDNVWIFDDFSQFMNNYMMDTAASSMADTTRMLAGYMAQYANQDRVNSQQQLSFDDMIRGDGVDQGMDVLRGLRVLGGMPQNTQQTDAASKMPDVSNYLIGVIEDPAPGTIASVAGLALATDKTVLTPSGKRIPILPITQTMNIAAYNKAVKASMLLGKTGNGLGYASYGLSVYQYKEQVKNNDWDGAKKSATVGFYGALMMAPPYFITVPVGLVGIYLYGSD